ncbi:hypothetical protein [Pedobacter nanyangensis]|uniref:hypothetical protein n=1 Tax=Pedobacter nanyangensis TaxID=1562389 RepID=UPI000DE528A2|nr:hypothetical protein [Pedobacter nanyangensis]
MEKRTKNHRLRLALESWWFGQLLLSAPAKVGFNGERWDYGAIAGMPNIKGLMVDDDWLKEKINNEIRK